MTLHQRNGRAPCFKNEFDRLVIKRVGFSVAAFCSTRFTGQFLGRVEQPNDIVWLAKRFQVIDDLMHLVVGHVGAVNALRQTGAWRQVEHVALAEQSLRPLLIKNGS